MKTDIASLEKFLKDNHITTTLDLSEQDLTDKDIHNLLPFLEAHPEITTLCLQNNPQLTNAAATSLAENTTLRTLRLQKGNNKITLNEGFAAFLTNTTITKLPFHGGKGLLLTQIRQHINENKMSPKPKKPVKAKVPLLAEEIAPATVFEDGETSFQTLYAYLMQDMLQYAGGNIEWFIEYAAIVLNMFMHAATYTPVEGHGKSQKREYHNKSQLQYYRSSGKHPMVKLMSALIGIKAQSCRMPFNSGFIKLLPILDDALHKELSAFDAWGQPTEKADTYVITRIAHTGARRNNFSVLVDALRKNGQGNTAAQFRSNLLTILPCKKKITTLPPEDVTKKIQDLLNCFKKIDTIEPKKKLAGNLLSYRIARIKNIKDNTAGKFKNMALNTSQDNLTCLLIRLYPNCKKKDGDYKIGVTNMILSFLGGLMNHHAQEAGLKLHTERRQSFGFFRPTLTDAGNLTVRLSLGLETRAFDNIVIKSLTDLDKLLGEYNFETQKPDTVTAVFKKPAGRKRDSYIRAVGTSDNNIYITFHQAMAYLQAAKKQPGGDDYVKKAFENFLTGYIIGNKQLPRHHTVTTNPPVQVCDSVVIDLLKNTLAYATKFASECTFLDQSDPLLPFAHSYWHSLLKLYNHCSEARHLLTQLDKMDSSDFCSQATGLVENILEYLISLDALVRIKKQLQHIPTDPVANFKNLEKASVVQRLDIPADDVSIYFADNGEQAITSTLLTLSQMLHGPAIDGKTYDKDVFLFGNSYFEVGGFMKDIKSCLDIDKIEIAKIVFTDVSDLQKLDLKQCCVMSALVIDITHHPVFDLSILKEKVLAAREHGAWVVIVKSYIKHGELGLDKYQAGGTFVLKPSSIALDKQTKKDLERQNKTLNDLLGMVSQDAMHPAAASYLHMVNEICCANVAPIQAMPAPTVTTLAPEIKPGPSQQRDKVSAKALIASGSGIAAKRIPAKRNNSTATPQLAL